MGPSHEGTRAEWLAQRQTVLVIDDRGVRRVGALLAGIAAYLSVRFLVRYLETRTLAPFAVRCLVAGVAATVRFAVS